MTLNMNFLLKISIVMPNIKVYHQTEQGGKYKHVISYRVSLQKGQIVQLHKDSIKFEVP